VKAQGSIVKVLETPREVRETRGSARWDAVRLRPRPPCQIASRGSLLGPKRQRNRRSDLFVPARRSKGRISGRALAYVATRARSTECACDPIATVLRCPSAMRWVAVCAAMTLACAAQPAVRTAQDAHPEVEQVDEPDHPWLRERVVFMLDQCERALLRYTFSIRTLFTWRPAVSRPDLTNARCEYEPSVPDGRAWGDPLVTGNISGGLCEAMKRAASEPTKSQPPP